jgi:hypothetical protein
MPEGIIVQSDDGQDPGKAPDNAEYTEDGATGRVTIDPNKPAEKPTKPEGIPDKFWNAETGQVDAVGLAKSYTELEKKLSQKETPKPEPKPNDVNLDPKQAAEALNKVGLDFNAIAGEFRDTGELSEATYQTLEQKGITREIVDQYIDGQMAIVTAVQNEIFSSLGPTPEVGKQSYTEMVEWAKDAFSESEIEQFNVLVESGRDAAKLAVAGLKARYQEANGIRPKLVTGENGPVTGTGFQSNDQVIRAVRDPRYKSDPAYRAEVQEKIKNSAENLLNVNVY